MATTDSESSQNQDIPKDEDKESEAVASDSSDSKPAESESAPDEPKGSCCGASAETAADSKQSEDKQADSKRQNSESASSEQSDSKPVADKPEDAKPEPPINLSESQQLHQHHVSKILDEVLEEPAENGQSRHLKHPMILDIVLAISLLVAMAGFTIGLFKMYLTHSAEQSITQHKYEAAIAILKGAPLPGFFSVDGSDPTELLNQALYLDALDKMENQNDIDGALNQLQQITPGSRFFTLAQEIINNNYEPSTTMLKMGVEHSEKNPTAETKPFNPELPKDASP